MAKKRKTCMQCKELHEYDEMKGIAWELIEAYSGRSIETALSFALVDNAESIAESTLEWLFIEDTDDIYEPSKKYLTNILGGHVYDGGCQWNTQH